MLNAFCSSLSFVSIPKSVKTIGDLTFYCCYDLSSITIPEGVVSIGDNAFFCGLTSIEIPASVSMIGNPFCCPELETITVSPQNPVLSVIDGALYSKADQRLVAFPSSDRRSEFTIPDGVTSIGDYAFYYCDNLTSITIPDGVTSIGDYAFYYCDNLTSITIPDGVTLIGDYAFEACRNLTAVTIPDGVTSIGKGTFRYCPNLESVVIPESVSSIGESAFGDFFSGDNITLTVTEGSFAEQYCIDNELTYIYPDSLDWLKG